MSTGASEDSPEAGRVTAEGTGRPGPTGVEETAAAEADVGADDGTDADADAPV